MRSKNTNQNKSDESISSYEWTLRAEQGDVDAQLNLGNMYFNGEGVPQDDKAAVKWYRLAAEQGNARAQHNLGTK